MAKRYSQEEIKQIQNLVAQGLSNREIAQQLGRVEAGIRNIRHRLKLKTKAQRQLRFLLQEKVELEKKVQGLGQTHTQLSLQLDSLQKRRQEAQMRLNIDDRALEQRLQIALIELKMRNPELFYITGTEQIANLAANIMQWLFS